MEPAVAEIVVIGADLGGTAVACELLRSGA
jgi:hypothetical protein